MTDREKLINLMIEAKKADTEDVPFSKFLADFLLANGVIVLPCKVGDTVYEISERYTECTPHRERYSEYACAGCTEICDSVKEHYIRPVEITNIHWIFNMWAYFGKTWFTDYTSAQNVLKAREQK